MELESLRRDVHVMETLASSDGVSHGRMRSAHWRKRGSLELQCFLGSASVICGVVWCRVRLDYGWIGGRDEIKGNRMK